MNKVETILLSWESLRSTSKANSAEIKTGSLSHNPQEKTFRMMSMRSNLLSGDKLLLQSRNVAKSKMMTMMRLQTWNLCWLARSNLVSQILIWIQVWDYPIRWMRVKLPLQRRRSSLNQNLSHFNCPSQLTLKNKLWRASRTCWLQMSIDGSLRSFQHRM